MKREALEQELFSNLLHSREQYPEMQARDVVKFLLQGMMGNGHLAGTKEETIQRLKEEMDTLEPDPEEPLTDPLSSYWLRLHLRRSMEERLTPEQIAQLMLLSDRICQMSDASPRVTFQRKDVYEACGRFAELAAIHVTHSGIEAANLALQIGKEKEHLGRENWLPSHSQLYRSLYRPAYRVISAAWAPYLEAVCRIGRAVSADAKTLVTLDGPCASGKTTLAELLAEVFDADVIHTDDYVVPHAHKTPERLAVPGGNCDWERLTEELLLPWKKGEEGIYRRYECRKDAMTGALEFPKKKVMILEGSYANVPAIRELADVRLFLETDPRERLRRLKEREAGPYLQGFFDRWIPLENAYLEAYHLPDPEMLRIRPAAPQ